MHRLRVLSNLVALVLAASALPVCAQEEGVSLLFGEDWTTDIPPLADDATVQADGDFVDAPLLALPEIAVPETPALAVQAEEIAAPQSPAFVPPPGWIAHDEYGIRFAVPADFAEIDRDEDEQGEITLALGRLNQSERTGLVYSFAFLPAREIASFPEELARDFHSGVTRAPAPRVIDGLAFDEYHVWPNAEAGEAAFAPELHLLAMPQPNDYGYHLLIAMAYAGVDRSDFVEVEETFLLSLRFDPAPAALGAPSPMDFRDGTVRYQVPPGGDWSNAPGPLGRWVTFEEGHVEYARVEIQELGTQSSAASVWLEASFNGPVAVREGEFDGIPVWIAEGRPTYTLSGSQRTIEGDAWRAMGVMTQLCPVGRGPITLLAQTTTDRIEAGTTLDSLLAPARLGLAGAAPCPDAVRAAMAEAMGRPAQQLPIQPPAAEPPSVEPSDVEPPPIQPPVVEPPAPPSMIPGKPGAQPPQPPADPEGDSWAEAESVATARAVLDHLRAFPSGVHAEAARAWLSRRVIMIPGESPGVPVPPPVTPDPEAIAWAAVNAAPSAAAMLAYLEDWPDGRHAQEARSWLATRAIMVPPAPTPPRRGK